MGLPPDRTALPRSTGTAPSAPGGASAPAPESAWTPIVLLPGILGGPESFSHLATYLQASSEHRAPSIEHQSMVGVISICYSTILSQHSISTWAELVTLIASLLRPLCSAHGPLRLVGYSFGCRVAYAVTQHLAAAGQGVALSLLDGPIGGPRGTLESAMLDLESSTSGRLVSLLATGGEEQIEPVSECASVLLFVASSDTVGVLLAEEHLPGVPVHRLSEGHRGILEQAAPEVSRLICAALAEFGLDGAVISNHEEADIRARANRFNLLSRSLDALSPSRHFRFVAVMTLGVAACSVAYGFYDVYYN